MEDLRIWTVDNDANAKITPLDAAGQTDSELLLEDILTRNPDMLEEGLQLVGRQTGTAGGPLDLLGVDRDGRLVVFELKRGTLNRDAVAQVIDYVSDLDAMDLDSLLARHVEVDSSYPRVKPRQIAQRFDERVRSLGVQDLVDAMTNTLADLFRNHGISFRRLHSTTRRHFYLDYSWRQANLKSGATLYIELEEGGGMLGFHPVAVELATPAEFDRLGTEGVNFERTPKESYLRYGQIDYGFKVSLPSLRKWSEHEEHLTSLIQRVLAGYNDAKQKALSEDGE